VEKVATAGRKRGINCQAPDLQHDEEKVRKHKRKDVLRKLGGSPREYVKARFRIGYERSNRRGPSTGWKREENVTGLRPRLMDKVSTGLMGRGRY